MPMQSSIELLESKFRSKVKQAIQAMEADEELLHAGVKKILPDETLRPLEIQLLYWMSGRMMDPVDVQKAYKRVLGYQPSLESCRKMITWTLESKHLDGKAIDMAPSKDGINKWWTCPRSVIARMGIIAKTFGIIWGGDWFDPDPKKSRDDPFHFEET